MSFIPFSLSSPTDTASSDRARAPVPADIHGALQYPDPPQCQPAGPGEVHMHCHQWCPDAGGEHRCHRAWYSTCQCPAEPQPEPRCSRAVPKLLGQSGSCTSIHSALVKPSPPPAPQPSCAPAPRWEHSHIQQGPKREGERRQHQIGPNAVEWQDKRILRPCGKCCAPVAWLA